MASEDVSSETHTTNDAKIVELLDAVDSRTQQQQVFHGLLSDGFISLARERYRDPLSTERLGRLVYDLREDVTSSFHIEVQEDQENGVVSMSKAVGESYDTSPARGSSLRRRRTNDRGKTFTAAETKAKARPEMANSFVAIPSSEVREAIRCFKLAVDQAVELINTNNKLVVALDNQ